MRILVLAPQPFMAQRGTPIAVKMLLETLSGEGHDLDTIVFADGEDVTIPNCRIIRVPALPGLKGIVPGFSIKKLLSDIVMFPMVAWHMARGRYDLVIAVEESAYMAMVLRPIFRVPYIIDVDSSIPEQLGDKYDLPGWLSRALNGAEGASARRAIGGIACCQALKDTVVDHAPDLPVQVLEDVTMLDHDDTRPTPDFCRFDEPVVMYVGNLESYQGIELLLRGFAALDLAQTPARLAVIGGSDAHIAQYTKLAADLGVSESVSFLGPRPVDDLILYLRAATIVASPRTQGRNTPMKIYSYLDSGRPLIATRLSTHTQVLDDDIAMLVDPTPDDMARGLRDLLADPALRDAMAARARDRVADEFSPQAYRRKLSTYINTVIIPRLSEPQESRP